MTNFHKHNYTVSIILGDPSQTPIWNVDKAINIFSSIKLMADNNRGNTGVRVLQMNGKKKQSYGKLNLDENSISKWAHNSGDDLRLFGNMEIWSPSWSICEKQEMAPDIYIQISNEKFGRCYNKIPKFNPIIIIATRHASFADATHNEMVLKFHVNVLGQIFTSESIPWGLSSGSGFTRSIQDMVFAGLFKIGNPHERLIDQNTFFDGNTFKPRSAQQGDAPEPATNAFSASQPSIPPAR